MGRSGTSTGLARRSTVVLDIAGYVVIALFAAGWTWSIVEAPDRAVVAAAGTPAGGAMVAALSHRDAPTAAYVTSAVLDRITQRMFAQERGISGKLRVSIDTVGQRIRPDTLPANGQLGYSSLPSGAPVVRQPAGAGIWHLVLLVGNAIAPVANFSMITEVPFSAKRGGRIGSYFIGSWPGEHGARLKTPAYANPTGFIEVTQANESTHVTEHFRLGDFVTHDQPNVWPKYIVLSPRLLDKLELVLEDLQQHGYDVHGVHVMSGFRTPQYNATGGDPNGRAAVSRHMYGDASDIFIDDDGDGQMDDLNHDGRVDINDARVILTAVDRVEAAHPELVGGAGVYVATAGHGPFIHIDARGYHARWVGTTGG